MGEAGRERIESVFAWNVVTEQYRELWKELEERRASARLNGNAQPMAHGQCRTPVCRTCRRSPPSGTLVAGGTGQRSHPAHRRHADLLSATADADPSLASLADNLKSKRQEGGQWLETNDLEQLYGHAAGSQPISGTDSPTCLRNWRL